MKAEATLAKIDQTLRLDQGAKFRRLLKFTMSQCHDAFKEQNSPFRNHLGASILGKECAREIWYTFRWTTYKMHGGRILRLFNRGHLEEARMVALLLMIDCKVYTVNNEGQQYRVKGTFGHAGGSLDSVVQGIPECPNEPLVTEFKTHNDSSFTRLRNIGLLKAKWEHYIQMQYYMGKLNLKGSLYMATNKNNDDLYAELIAFDKIQYNRTRERARIITEAILPPPRISRDPTWHRCKFCDYRKVCHHKDRVERTCRSCKHIEIRPMGEWRCNLHDITLTEEAQRKACPSFRLYEEN